jgi:hypothetical protein
MPRRDHDQIEDPTDSLHPWDRVPGESSRAYEAFCVFRDAGPSRKMDKVWRSYEREHRRVVPEHRRCASSWWEWYRRFDWKDRAEKYDAFLELNSRRLRESAHKEKVEAHLDRQRQISVAVQNVALRMLQVAQKELQRTNPQQEPGQHTLPPTKLAGYVRTAAWLAQWGSEAEASALGVDELIGLLNESESQS